MKATETKPDGTTVTIDTDAPPVAKTVWDGEHIATRVVKAEAELRSTLNVVYPADKADVAVALDGHRDFASKEVVRKAAWDYLRHYREVGTYHADVTGQGMSKGAAEVVESYIYEGPDWQVGDYVVKAGDWLARFVWIPEVWELIKAGKITGVSVEGAAKRRKPTQQALQNLRS